MPYEVFDITCQNDEIAYFLYVPYTKKAIDYYELPLKGVYWTGKFSIGRKAGIQLVTYSYPTIPESGKGYDEMPVSPSFNELEKIKRNATSTFVKEFISKLIKDSFSEEERINAAESDLFRKYDFCNMTLVSVKTCWVAEVCN
jgi:hypothetical protein